MTESFLEKIIDSTQTDIALAKSHRSIDELFCLIKDAPAPRSFLNALDKRSTEQNFVFIAEIKNRSPSVGEMLKSNLDSAMRVYEKSSIVQAVSVVTNKTHFSGHVEEMKKIRNNISKPVLMKDFVIDVYQIYEARAYYADAVLLMASILDQQKLKEYYDLVQELGMEALFEIHTLEELQRLPDNAKIIGINSRKFKQSVGFIGKNGYSTKDFSINLETFDLVSEIPNHKIRVAESGITPSSILDVKDKFDAALIGTSLLRHKDGVQSALDEFELNLMQQRDRRND